MKRYVVDKAFWSSADWTIDFGRMKTGPGNPGKTPNLLLAVGEKLPFACLDSVRDRLKKAGISEQGVYLAHDSIGCPRYAGRGNIFGRLKEHQKAHPHELQYFSFYVVAEKKHEREVETLLIRGAAFSLIFNDRKKRVGINPGDFRDYEAGTWFFERK